MPTIFNTGYFFSKGSDDIVNVIIFPDPILVKHILVIPYVDENGSMMTGKDGPLPDADAAFECYFVGHFDFIVTDKSPDNWETYTHTPVDTVANCKDTLSVWTK